MARTRQALVDSGLRLADRVGLTNLSVNLVVQEAGVAKGTFFHHFGDRASYLLALHREFHDRLAEQIQEAITGLPPGRRRLIAGANAYLDGCLRDRGVRASDIVVRYGGDEFVVLMPDTDKPQAGAVAQRLHAEISGQLFRVGDEAITCTASVGVATFPEDAVTIAGETRDYAGRHFCPRCGSSVFSRSGDEIEVNLGSLDAIDQFKPTYELWTVRRESWLPPFPLARRYERNRDATSRSEE